VFGVEGAMRHPLSSRTRVRIQQVGLAVIVSIVILAARNDVIRFFL
jgi:membrane-associated protease RseP (regulator of RpoE activity)